MYLHEVVSLIKFIASKQLQLANDNRTTPARLNSAFAEKSLDAVLGKAGMT